MSFRVLVSLVGPLIESWESRFWHFRIVQRGLAEDSFAKSLDSSAGLEDLFAGLQGRPALTAFQELPGSEPSVQKCGIDLISSLTYPSLLGRIVSCNTRNLRDSHSKKSHKIRLGG
jgi:hypothetical protein